MLSTIRPRESSAKWNAFSDAAGLTFTLSVIFLALVPPRRVDPPFTFVKEQLCITNREIR
jgi:hypothetical protein